MRPAQHPSARWLARIVVAAVAAALLPLIATGPAAADTAVCTGPASVFDVKANGDLWLYQNASPATGSYQWSNIHRIGTGWLGTTFAGAAGDLYNITPSGELRALRFDTAGNSWYNNAGHVTLGTGFGRYLAGQPGANMITADAGDEIYTVDAQGVLRSYNWDHTSGELYPGTVLDTGWNKYTRIFGAGRGTLYAVDAQGVLYRFHVGDTFSNTFTEYADPVGTNWATVSNVFSAGGDVIYAIDAAGSLLWFRFDDATQTWANGGAGTLVGSGWTTDIISSSATTDTCFSGDGNPPLATPPAPVNTIGEASATPGGTPYYVFTQPWHGGGADIDIAQDNGPAGLTGPTLIGEHGGWAAVTATRANGDLTIAALDTSGGVGLLRDGSTDTEGFGDAGNSLKSLGLTAPDGQVQLFGVGANGHLWGAQDAGGGPELGYWHDLTPSLDSTSGTLTGPLAVATSGHLSYGVGTLSTGATGYFTRAESGDGAGGALTASVLPGSAGYQLPVPTDGAAVPTLFARSSQGQVSVYTAADSWVPLPVLPFAAYANGISSAVVAPGVIGVVVSGSDGYVYASTQVSGTTYSPWQRVAGGSRSAATPASPPTLYSSDGTSADLAYRGADGAIYHFHSPAPVAGAFAFTGGPHS